MSMKYLFFLLFMSVNFTAQFSFSQTKLDVKRLSNYFPNLSNHLNKQSIPAEKAIKNFDTSLSKTAICRNDNILIINKNGEILTNFELAELELNKPNHFKWNSTGTEALVSVNHINQNKRSLAKLRINGELQLIVEARKGEQILQPSWSSNNNKFVFLSSNMGNKLIIQDVDTKKQIIISENGGSNPVWLHNSNKIVYARSEVTAGISPVRKLYLYDLDSNSNKVLFDNYNGIYPVVSPDDSFVLIDIGHNFAIINLDGKIIKEFKSSKGYSESISPNGKSFAYLKAIIEGDPGRLVTEHLHIVDINSGVDVDITPDSSKNIRSYLWDSNNNIIY